MLEKLGTGGMANVWEARQMSLDRIVAIKTLSKQFSADAADIRNFVAEAQSAAKLKHPGIVQVYDANVVQGLHYIVMEYVDGATVYFALTGVEVFGGYSCGDVLQMQLTEKVSDPMDINPKVSKMTSTLIEAMLAKDRRHRHRDWPSLLEDLARVRKCRALRRRLPFDAVSTIRRSRKREAAGSFRKTLPADWARIAGRGPAGIASASTPARAALLTVLILLAIAFILIKPANPSRSFWTASGRC
ncbi:MAG: protein kinase [Verrucomicrobiota bacterium]|nr:protein kinase [Verrucomicrobiota bacterium]